MSISGTESKQNLSSTITGSATSESSHQDDESAKKKFLESTFFPLYAEITCDKSVPQIIYVLQYLILVIQAIISSIYVGSQRTWTTKPKFFYYIFSICDLYMTSCDTNIKYLVYILMIVAFFVIVLSLVMAIYTYTTYHSFKKRSVYFIKYSTLVFGSILLPVYTSICSTAISDLFQQQSSLNIASVILLIPITFAAHVGFYFIWSLICSSPIIIKSCMTCWSSTIIYMQIACVDILIFSSIVLDSFPSWLQMATLIGAITTQIILILKCFIFPFMYFELNPIFCGLCCAVAVNCAITFFAFFVNVPYIMRIASPIVVYSVGWIAFRYILRTKYMLYSKRVSRDNNGPVLTDAEKKKYFDDFVFKSVDDAVAYLRVGLETAADYVVDFSFQRYLAENYSLDPIIIAVAKTAAFFPSELHFFTYCITIFEEIKNMKICDYFLGYLMRHVHITRQSSVSNEISHIVASTKKKGLKAIQASRGFWLSVLNGNGHISLQSLYLLNQQCEEAESSFKDALEQFPNSIELCNAFATFQIECLGNYTTALYWKKRASSVEKGRAVCIDNAFRSFVSIYPHYLTRKILSPHGGIGLNNLNISSTVSDSDFDCINTGLKQDHVEMIATHINDGQFRLGMQHALSKLSFGSVKALKIASYLLPTLFVVVFIAILFAIQLIVSDIDCSTVEVYNFSKSLFYFVYSIFASSFYMSLYTESNNGQNYSDLNFINRVINNISDLPDNGIVKNSSLFMHQQSLNMIEALYNTTIYINTYGKERLETNTIFINSSNILPIFATINNYSLFELSVRGIYSLVSSNIHFINALSPLVFPLNEDFNMTTTLVMSLMYFCFNATAPINDFLEQLVTDGKDVVNVRKSSTNGLSYGLSSVVFVLFSIYSIYVIVLYIRDTKLASSAICSVNEQIIKQSLYPIGKTSEIRVLANGASMNVNTSDRMKIFLPLVLFFYIIVACILILLSCKIDVELSKFSTTFDYMNVVTLRQESILKFFTEFVAEIMYGEDDIFSEIDLKEAMQISINNSYTYQSKILIEVTGFSDEFDQVHLTSKCDDDASGYVKCLTLDKQIEMLILYMESLLKYLEYTDPGNYTLQLTEFISALYINDQSIYNGTSSLYDCLLDNTVNIMHSIRIRTISLCVTGILISLIFFVILLNLESHIDKSFSGMKQVIRLLPPTEVVKNPTIRNLFKGSSDDGNEVTMSPSELIIHSASVAVISLSPQMIIENMNPMTYIMTGFSEDQISRRPLTFLIPMENDVLSTTTMTTLQDTDGVNPGSMFIQRIENLITNPELSQFTCTVPVIKEDGSYLIASSTVLKMMENNRVSSIVIILTDLSKDVVARENAIKAKKYSSRLLNGLIPTGVRKRMDENPMFISSKSTLVCLGVKGFSSIVTLLQPSRVMDILFQFITRFDDVSKRYSTIHRIKASAELTMYISGLFDQDIEPYKQISETLAFCSDLLEELKVTNEYHSLDFQLAIALTHGGPFVGRLMSASNPTFEVYSSAIKDIKAMMSFGTKNVIQCLENVIPLIPNEKYSYKLGPEVVCQFTKQRYRFYHILPIKN